MSRIELTGLRADLPIGAMAAFGCLRIANRSGRLAGSKLSWMAGGGSFHAVLWAPEDASRDDLIAALVDDVQQAAERWQLNWSEQIKTASREGFREAAKKALDEATVEAREAADWFAAFGSELAVDDGKVQATPFDMSVARQRFLADAKKLAAALGRGGPDTVRSCEEALFGPWRYADDQHSLGWDPSTMKLGAFTYKAPTAMANAGVRAAVWLAFESLPLFPCCYDGGLRTRAFWGAGREAELCWPVWEKPISLSELGSLLGLPAVVREPPNEKELRARGVTAVYRSARFKPNKYLASFRPARLAFSGGAMAGVASGR